MSLPQTIYEFTTVHPGSLSVMFVYIPLYLLGYYALPPRYRAIELLTASLHFYYMMAGKKGVAILVGSMLLDYVAVQLMEQWDQKQQLRLGCMVFSTVKNLGLILLFTVSARLRMRPLTLGVQIYALCSLSCVRDIYRRAVPYERDLIRFGLYCAFFPRLYAGPLMAYQDFTAQLEGIRLEPGKLLFGAGQYIQGAFKMSILGGSLYTLCRQIGSLSQGTVLSAWIGVLAFALMLYYLLSGLSEAAQGIGTMFSIRMPKNFYYPYQSRNIGDFFVRFNITVHGFIENLLRGIFPSELTPLAGGAMLFGTGLLAGLWFGLRWSYLLWGVYIGVFLVMERYLYPKMLTRIPVLFARVGTLAVVLAGFTIFMSDSLSQCGSLIRALFAFAGPLVNDQVLYLLSSNWLLLLLSCFAATNATSLLVGFFRKQAPRCAAVVLGFINAAIAVIYVALSL